MQKKILTLLVLLMTAVTGAWAQEQSETIATTDNTVEGTHFTIDNNDCYVDDQGMNADGGITVTPKNGETITKVVISCTYDPSNVNDGNTSVSSGTKEITNGGGTITVTGVNASTFTFTCSNDNPQFRQFVVYYTEASAGPAESIDLTTTDNLTWTLSSMPEYNVELEIKYCDYPAATLTAAPTAKTDLLFTGSALPLVDAGTAANGTLYYALGTADAAPTEESDWSTDVPTASAAGVYYVWYLVMGDATHNGIDPAGPLTVTIKANITAADVTAPTAVENLKYKGVPQALIVAGSVTGGIGTMQYRLGTDGTWSTDIPTATDKGDYTVYYKVVGDDCHNDYVPAEGIAVTIGEGAEMAARLTVTGNTGTSCTAMLLDAATYQPLASGVKVGEKFILSTVKEDGYDFNVTGASTTEFTAEEYLAYYNYAKDNDIYVSLNTSLLWVTMPHVESGNLNLEVNFQQMLTYTLLYQPATGQNPQVVACKMERSVNGVDKVTYMAMQRGASMGDGTAVWSMTMQAAFGPKRIAFVPVAEGTSEDALTTALNSAALSNATISQSPDTWKSLSGANYLIYGGNAKVATAIFVADGGSMTVFKDLEADEATTEGGMTYKLAVCVTDAQGRVTTPGTVTAPAAPAAPQGKQFGGWRGLTYVAGRPTESVFTAGSTINVYGTTTFTAVWTPLQIQTTFALNGGEGVTSPVTKNYQETLSDISEATRKGFVLDYWKVVKSVNENGILFGKGSKFDMNTPLTANLNLTAQWKHVHEYVSYPISAFGDALADYMKYNKVLHIAICNCNDIKIVEHEFNPAGRCACGYEKPGATQVQLEIAYGKLDGTTFNKFMEGFPQFAKRGDEVTVEAFHNWGDLEFKTWQYSTDGGQTWEELAAFEIVGFLIPCNMKVRALYVNPVQTPTIELASSEYLEPYEYQGTTYKMGNILYQMDYKLPDGYKLLDAGIRLGDNAGISYYIEQTQKYSLDAEAKGVAAGIGAGVAAVGVVSSVFLGGGFDAFGFAKDYGQAMFNKTEEVVYLEREDNVIEKEDKIDAAILAKKMYEGTPINVEKYDPIYWEAKAPTKGLFGSICTTPPLRFAQKNNQDHYIYGIAYMRYETPDKQMKTLYTDAIAATVNNPSQHTSKMEQEPSARQAGSGFSSDETAAAARKAPKRKPEQQEAETLDMSTVTAPQTQLVVYVDGDYSADLSDAYGYNETVTVTAPTVAGKTFSYWQADGGTVVTTDADLTLTMKANTTLRAVYGAATVPAASVGITSATRSTDGQSIVLQAIANGTFDTAGFVYSTTVAVPEINTDGVTRVGAVSYSNLSLIDQQPASILDRNNCFSLTITPDDETTVYHVRAYTYKGSDVSYSEVRDVKLSTLKSGLMLIANLEAFETGVDLGIDSLLTQLREQGRLVAGYPITVAAGEFATFYAAENTVLSDATPEGISRYTITDVSTDHSTVTLAALSGIVAGGTPMLVYNGTDDDQTVILMRTTDAATANNVDIYTGFKGTLVASTIAASTNDQTNYALNGKQFVWVKNALSIAANKCWLEVVNSNARAISILFTGETTGIATATRTEATGDLYDLNGRKVLNPTRKGIYIQNGKKAVVK